MKKCGCGCEMPKCDCNIIHEKEVNEAKVNLIDGSLLSSVSSFYKALADNTRIRIMSLLVSNHLCVCDISACLNMTKSAVSHQLKYLKDMNLIKCERKGKEVWYSLADDHVREVFDVTLEHVSEEENG